jgi:hypothetical protein
MQKALYVENAKDLPPRNMQRNDIDVEEIT